MALTGVGRVAHGRGHGRCCSAPPLSIPLGDAPRASASRPTSDRVTTTIVIPVGGAASGFSPQDVSVERGGQLTVVNNDNMAHTVTSEAVGTQGDPLFDLTVPSHATRTLVLPAALGAGEYPFYCSFHPSMRGTLTITGEAGEVPEPPAFEQPLRIPKVLTGSNLTIDMRQRRRPGHASWSEDADVDVRRNLPRAHDQAADGIVHQGHLRPRPAEEGGFPDRSPARWPPELGRRRAAHPPPHPQGNPSDLHLPARRQREADAGGLPLLPRPPDGPDGPQQLAWAPGHVPRDRPA